MGFVAVGLAFDHRRSFPAGRQRVSGGQRSPGFDKPARQPNSPRRRFDNDAAAAATVADCYQLGMPRVVEQCFHRIIPRDQAAHVDVGVAQLPAGQRVSPHAFDLEVHAIAPIVADRWAGVIFVTSAGRLADRFRAMAPTVSRPPQDSIAGQVTRAHLRCCNRLIHRRAALGSRRHRSWSRGCRGAR